jgi:hypothetical protein
MERSTEEVDKALANPDNFANSVQFRKLYNGGRPKGCQSIPPLVKDLMVSSRVLGDSTKEVADTFGVHPKTVERTMNGKVGGDKFDPELAKKVEEKKENKREEVADKALETLADLFNTSLSKENLGTLKPMEAVSAAKGLAEVVERVSEKKDSGKGGNQNNFIIFRPEVKDESEYPAIDVTPVKELQ